MCKTLCSLYGTGWSVIRKNKVKYNSVSVDKGVNELLKLEAWTQTAGRTLWISERTLVFKAARNKMAVYLDHLSHFSSLKLWQNIPYVISSVKFCDIFPPQPWGCCSSVIAKTSVEEKWTPSVSVRWSVCPFEAYGVLHQSNGWWGINVVTSVTSCSPVLSDSALFVSQEFCLLFSVSKHWSLLQCLVILE